MTKCYNKRFKLTPVKDVATGRFRWRKKYKGKVRYFNFSHSEYKQAYEACKAWMAEVDGENEGPTATAADLQRAIDHWTVIVGEYEGRAADGDNSYLMDTAIAAAVRSHLASMAENSQPPYPAVEPYLFDPLEFIPADKAWVWRKFSAIALGHKEEASPGKSIQANLKKFLATMRAKAENGGLSIGRYDNLRVCLEPFRDWAGPTVGIDTITGEKLLAYHAELVRCVSIAKFTAIHARDRMAAVTQFIRWLYRLGILENLPRVLVGRNTDLEIRVPTKKVKTFGDEEVKTLLGAASDRTKLYLLLCLNCGMTQKDIADLQPDEVDLKAGRLRRKRSKTRHHENVPVVDYKLWPATIALLKEHASDDPDRLLLNEDGNALYVEWLNERGQKKKRDGVASAYDRLRRKTGLSLSFKIFRKTGRSKLDDHGEFSRYAKYYLGQSPRGVDDVNYRNPSAEQFDAAIDWLGEQFGQTAARPRKPR